MMKNDTFESLVPGPSCSGPKSIGPKYFRAEVYKQAEVFSGPKLFPGRSILQAEVVSGRIFSGPKYFRAEVFWAEVFPGQSECRAKAVAGPNWVWALLRVLLGVLLGVCLRFAFPQNLLALSPSGFEAHAVFFRLVMKGIFDAYIWPFDQNWFFEFVIHVSHGALTIYKVFWCRLLRNNIFSCQKKQMITKYVGISIPTLITLLRIPYLGRIHSTKQTSDALKVVPNLLIFYYCVRYDF